MEKLPYSIPARLRTYVVRVSDPKTHSARFFVQVGCRKDILHEYQSRYPNHIVTLFVESRNR